MRGDTAVEHSRSGFSLVTMVLTVLLLVVLAGVVAPVVTDGLQRAEKSDREAAATMVGKIAAAIDQYRADTSHAPTGSNGAAMFHWLYSAGKTPSGNPFSSGSGTELREFLAENGHKTNGWRGPYLQSIGEDPWGSRYVVNANGFFSSRESAWVLSAGPNQRIDTGTTDRVAKEDDIAVLIR